MLDLPIASFNLDCGEMLFMADSYSDSVQIHIIAESHNLTYSQAREAYQARLRFEEQKRKIRIRLEEKRKNV